MNIIEPISKDEIIKEISAGCFVRKTNKGCNDIYILDAISQPQTMREIGRLRELSFREAGAGTGNSFDIDHHDLDEHGYKQLIVWDPIEQEIIGGYRFIVVDTSIDQSFSLTTYFDMNEEFRSNILPYVIELGRSFVQPKYQLRTDNRKGIFALDNLWDGLGAIVVNNPAKDEMLISKKELSYEFDKDLYINLFDGCTYEEAVKVTTKKAKDLNKSFPPLFFAYANLSVTMRTFGTIVNPDFGNVLETAIMVTVEDIKKDKYDRHISSYVPVNNMQ